MKVLLTGASSLPGYRTLEELLKENHGVIALHYRNPIPLEHCNLTKIRLDITDLVRLQDLILKKRPGVIIHMAAYGDVDGCEKDKAYAWKVNVEPTITIAKMANVVKAYVLYLSTDYVFDGRRGLYKEQEPPSPINYYGFTKAMAETIIKATCDRWSIVRTSSIYGLGPGRRNFAKYIIEKLSKGEPIKALIDQYTSPTHAKLLAQAIMELINRQPQGIFHIAGERMNRHEFALKVAEALDFDKALIQTTTMDGIPWYAPRPKDSSLDITETKSKVKTNFYSTTIAMEILKQEYSSPG